MLSAALLATVVAQSALEIQFVERDDDGIARIADSVVSTTGKPAVNVRIESCVLGTDDEVRLVLSGRVYDPVASIDPSRANDLGFVTLDCPTGQPLTAPLVPQAGTGGLWEPYRFVGEFKAAYRFRALFDDEHTVTLETPPNAAGETATAHLTVSVSELAPPVGYTLQFDRQPDPLRIDTVRFYAGPLRAGLGDQVLVETGPGTNVYRGSLFWGDVELGLTHVSGFTWEPDTLQASGTVWFTAGGSEPLVLWMEEDGPSSLRFKGEAGRPTEGPFRGGRVNLLLPTATRPCQVFMGGPENIGGARSLMRGAVDTSVAAGRIAWGQTFVRAGGPHGERIPVQFQVTARDGSTFESSFTMQRDPSVEGLYFAEFPKKQTRGAMAYPVEQETGPARTLLVRVKDPFDELNEFDSALTVFDKDHPIRRYDFGDGPYWYAVDEHGAPLVLMACFEGGIPGQAGQVDGFLAAEVKKAGQGVAKEKVEEIYGLKINTGDIDQVLADAGIKGFSTLVTPKHKEKVYYLKPNDKLTRTDDKVATEVYWRLISLRKGFYTFRKPEILAEFVRGREEIVKALKEFKMNWVSNSPTKTSAGNPAYWQLLALPALPDGKLRGENELWAVVKKRGVKAPATEAIADMADDKSDDKKKGERYYTGCYLSASYSMLRAASLTWPTDRFERRCLPDNPKANLRPFVDGGTKIHPKPPTLDPNLSLPGDWWYV